MPDSIVVLNRGQRTFKLKPLITAEGKKVERILPPGGSIEVLDEAEAAHLLSYTKEIADAAKVVPANAQRVKDLQKQIDKLTADNARLQGIQQEPKAESEPEQEAPEASEPDAPKKKKGR